MISPPFTLPSLQGVERRAVCVLFADLVNSTGLAHALTLEAYCALMAETLQLLMLACVARGGEVLPLQGDAVLALWNAPYTDAALQTAWELHGRLADLDVARRLRLRLALRVGLASGEVLRGPVGGAVTAYGLPLNLSRRLCDAAEPGGTLACERTMSAAKSASFSPLPPRSLPGFALARAGRLVAPPKLLQMKSS